ncbi:MAG TPA: Virginiamycin B lyase [Thermoanaerobaculia bacterium]|nr:Virginiamycin B lyase [Thermoanaerobaculia bacterium]
MNRVLLALSFALPVAASAQTVTTYPIPVHALYAHNAPVEIVEGSDGAMWFTEGYGAIGRIDANGALSEFLLDPASDPRGIALGPDGNVWFTEGQSNLIGRITAAGSITEYAVPTPAAAPTEIVAGPDGALWFTEFNAGKIGRIDLSGSIVEYPLHDRLSGPLGIASGPGNALSFTENTANRIGRITLSGEVAEIDVPTVGSQPGGITVDGNGTVWFAEERGDKIAKLDATGITEYSVKALSNPLNVIATSDALYFTLYYGYAIGRLTADGSYSEIPLMKNSHPLGITRRHDGSIWFTEYSEDIIGTFDPAAEMAKRNRAARH